MMKLLFTYRRIIVGVLLLIPFFCMANYYLDLEAFRGFDKEVFLGSLAAAVLALRYLTPEIWNGEWSNESREKKS